MAYGFNQKKYTELKILCERLGNRNVNVGRAVPRTIATNMVHMIPDSWFSPDMYITNDIFDVDAYTEDHRVLDVCCNSGILLERFYQRFEMSLLHLFDNSYEAEDYIKKNLLYGFCTNARLANLLRQRIYWCTKENICHGHIYHYNMCDGTGTDSKYIHIEDDKIEMYDSEIKRFRKMKFGVVMGHPPYNNDIYLDFVFAGHKLASDYDLWLTPDLWRFDTNKEFIKCFQNDIVPFISKIGTVDSKDLFDGVAPFTVTYFLVTRKEYIDKYLNGKFCENFNRLESFDTE